MNNYTVHFIDCYGETWLTGVEATNYCEAERIAIARSLVSITITSIVLQ